MCLNWTLGNFQKYHFYSEKTLMDTLIHVFTNLWKEHTPNVAQQSCCVSETEWELLGGFESTVCRFTHKEMANKYIQEKHSLLMIWTVQWRGALISHLVPSTILSPTNNGVLFLLPFTLETSGHSWGRCCCLYPSQPDGSQPLLPLGALKNMENTSFFTSVCPCGTTHLYLFFPQLDSSRSALWDGHMVNILFVTVAVLVWSR